jgi:RinA family phage transcriptional activator
MRLRYSTLQKANFKMIEFELQHLKNTKKVYAESVEEVIEGSGVAPEIRGSQISKTTEQKAMKLVSSLQIAEMKKRIEAIEYVMSILPKNKLELLEEKYFKKQLTDYGIMQKLNIEQATFYRYRREIIQLIADRLGWQI